MAISLDRTLPLKALATNMALSLFLSFFSADASPLGKEPEIRVQVIEETDRLVITGDDPIFTLTDQLGKHHEHRAKTITASPTRKGISVNGTLFSTNQLHVENSSSYFHIGDRSFRGKLSMTKLNEQSLSLIDTLPLEEYLVGIINSEISSHWPLEAIKAQAVAARTYAFATLRRVRNSNSGAPSDIRNTMFDQVYHGAHMNDDVAEAAVIATRGEVLMQQGQPITSYYHSCCGGQTEHAHNVWSDAKGPPLVIDRFCARSPKLTWEYRIPIETFAGTLRKQGIAVGMVESVEITPLANSPRVAELVVISDRGLASVRATDLRKFFGYINIKSTWFNVGLEKSEIVFAGRGYGHGVGMCQWGAKGMAEDGHRYQDILKFYYPTADLVTAY